MMSNVEVDPSILELDLLSRIKMVREASGFSFTNKFLADLVASYEMSLRGGHFDHLLSKVWGGKTTFEEEYAKKGVTKELSDLIGPNDDNRYRDQLLVDVKQDIKYLSREVRKAMTIKTAKFLYERLKEQGFDGTPRSACSGTTPPIHIPNDWYPVLDRLRAVQGPIETAMIEKKKGFFKGFLDGLNKCTDAARQLARKKKYDLFITDVWDTCDFSKAKCTFSFYKVDDRIYTWI